MSRFKTFLLTGAAIACLPTVASAQSATPAATQATDSTGQTDDKGLKDIVVTATRRSTGLQQVAATVAAVPAATLKTYNITGVLQLPSLVPGLVVTPSGGNNIYMRGIGSASTGFNEAQVAMYIDGLYLANPTAGITSFNNIDRIEVLKGPQGTLYGRNATGGLISVTTRDPGEKTKLDVSIGYANYNTATGQLYASTPITDNLGINVAVYHQKQSDGWSINTYNGHDAQKSVETGVETKLKWQPGANTKVTGTFIFDYNNRDTGYAYQVYPGTLGSDGTPYLGKYRFASRIDAGAPTTIYIGTVKVEQDLGFATLSSLSGFQTSTAQVFFQGGLPILGQPVAGQQATYNPFYEHNQTYTEELQITSKPSSSRLDWVGGAFYYQDRTELRLDTYNTCVNNTCAPGAVAPNRNDGFPNTFSTSVYGDGTYRFFKATRLTVGLRYTNERKTLSGQVTPLAGQPNSVTTLPASTVFYPGQPFAGYPDGIPTSLHFEKLTYRFVLAQDLTRDIHLYASHNLGFKSGAFNGNAFNNPPVRPELLYATEAGLKSEWFNHRLRANLAYFHYTYKDVQVRSLVPPATSAALLLNAASERVDGVDGDFTIAPFKGFVINGSFEYLDGKYVSFPGTTIATPRPTGGAVIQQNVNLAGYALPFAAPVSASLGATYTLLTNAGSFALSANGRYNESYAMASDNSIRQGQHTLVDMSLNWTSTDKHYDVNLFVRNLTNQYTYAAALVSSNFAVVPGAPRTFGATLGYHY